MFLCNFCRDERGSVLIYFTIVMLVLFGLVGLATTIAKSPTCNQVAGAADRRILSVAIINCDPNNPVTGNKYKFLESRTYADFFLTRPVGQDNVIWAEFVRFLTPQSDGSKLKHIVELVR